MKKDWYSSTINEQTMIRLSDCFFEESHRWTLDRGLISDLWTEVVHGYSFSGRCYHTIEHLTMMHELLLPLKSEFENWTSVFFAIIYHDLIYEASQTNNEERSAERAVVCLNRLGLPQSLIIFTSDLILATKQHKPLRSSDSMFFLDADLAVLGASSDEYLDYSQQIRREYSIYSDDVYEKGRVNALMHFLKMERIYQSDYFFERFEQNARRNIKNEIEMLRARL